MNEDIFDTETQETLTDETPAEDTPELTPEEAMELANLTVADLSNEVTVEERGAGPKIQWRQDGATLYFGDDELPVHCDKRQKDWPVHTTISIDADGNLTMGPGKWFAADITIPGAVYVVDGDEQVKAPIRMHDVTLLLWSMNGSPWKGGLA